MTTHVYDSTSANTLTRRYVAAVKIDNTTGDRMYTILFEDGDVLTDTVRSKVQFLDRPKPEDIEKETLDLILSISSGMSGDGNEDIDVDDSRSTCKSNSLSIIDITRNNNKISDPERSEVYGQNDLC